MRLAEEAKLRNQMSAKRAKAEAERKHQVISVLGFCSRIQHLFPPLFLDTKDFFLGSIAQKK